MMYIMSQMHSSHDDLVVCVRWLGATVFLTVPSFLPDVEQWIRLLSVTFGSVTAFIGMVIMFYKLKDLLKKRKSKSNA